MPESGDLSAPWQPRPGADHDEQSDSTGQQREKVAPTVGGHPAIVAPPTPIPTQLGASGEPDL